jgi:hypothetical protein
MTICAVLSRIALMSVAVLSVACGSTPVAPTAATVASIQPTAAPPPVPPTTSFPPLSGASRSFTFDHPVANSVMDYTKHSQFVLYDNGAFALKYDSLGGEYRGGYTESNGVINFQWEGWSTAGSWGATGSLKDGSLTVRYNLIMMLSDFEDAVYDLRR